MEIVTQPIKKYHSLEFPKVKKGIFNLQYREFISAILRYITLSYLDRTVENFGVIARPRTHWYLDKDVVNLKNDNINCDENADEPTHP